MLENRFFLDGDGKPDGGQSVGDGFVIAWQRGALDKGGRNGAFLLEVLKGCTEWISWKSPVQSGFGFVIHFTEKKGYAQGLGQRETLSDVLCACDKFLQFADEKFPCEENAEALKYLGLSIHLLGTQPYRESDLPIVRIWLIAAIEVLQSRARRRELEGSLGTHKPDRVDVEKNP